MGAIKISVPAKIHLLGEHTVVYGKPALLSAINLRVTVTISASSKKYQHAQQNPDDHNAHAMQKAIESAIKTRFKLKSIPTYHIQLESQIPMGYGLGSSAAISAAYAAALLSFLKINWDKSLVNDIAYEGEKIFHGNPSGGDVAAVIHGGFIWFRKELENLRIIHPIKQQIHPKVGEFLLVDSGKPAELTKELVTAVSSKLQTTNPDLIGANSKLQTIFDSQELLTKQLLTALLEGNNRLIVTTIQKGEKNLEQMGVVGEKAKSIISKIEAIGGGCKIIGGGGVKKGSGMLLTYHPNIKKLLTLIKKNNWKYIRIKLSEDGLKTL